MPARTMALNSSALPLGSKKNIVICGGVCGVRGGEGPGRVAKEGWRQQQDAVPERAAAACTRPPARQAGLRREGQAAGGAHFNHRRAASPARVAARIASLAHLGSAGEAR